MTYDTWKTTEPAVDEWDETGCKWCTGISCAECGDGSCEHEWPCSADCERLAVLATREKRIARLEAAITRATKLRDQYRAEGDTHTERLSGVKARIVALRDEYEAALSLQVRDLKEAAE